MSFYILYNEIRAKIKAFQAYLIQYRSFKGSARRKNELIVVQDKKNHNRRDQHHDLPLSEAQTRSDRPNLAH